MRVFLHFCIPSLLVIAFGLTAVAETAKADPGVIAREDLVPFGQVAWTVPGFEMPTASPGLPILDRNDTSAEAALLRRLDLRGQAAGFDAVIYDNRDRDHSPLPEGQFPRLPRLYLTEELRKLSFDYGLAGQIILPAIVVGNSSTAITSGDRQRSQPRLAMTSPKGPVRAFLTYVTNHLYIYPEHRDHDDADLFPANWPYMVITQGSSYSDKPFVRAFLLSVAAFKKETQKRLRQKNLIAPTLQMILRRSLKPIYTRKAYLSALAHPTVFSKNELAPERMVSLAASIEPDEIPPMVQLTVEKEDFAAEAGLADLSETLFDTPSAIARTWRSFEYTRRMVVSAAKTADPNGHDLQFSWVLLRGDRDKVRITPINNGAAAEISIDWHDTRRITPTQKRVTDRVDIGVFAWNGYLDSAPAFISVNFPGHQIRQYETTPDGSTQRLVSVDYDALGRDVQYDPDIFWTAAWKDTLIYDKTGKLTEFNRQLPDKTVVLPAQTLSQVDESAGYTLKSKKANRFLLMTPETDQTQ